MNKESYKGHINGMKGELHSPGKSVNQWIGESETETETEREWRKSPLLLEHSERKEGWHGGAVTGWSL